MTPSPSATLGKLLTGRGSRQGLWLLPLLITVAMILWLAATTSQFSQWSNLANLVAQGMPLLITAVGQMFVVLVGGLDLSIGSVVSFTTAILALDLPTGITIPGVFIFAALIGAFASSTSIRISPCEVCSSTWVAMGCASWGCEFDVGRALRVRVWP